jgi:hypothetical protein
MKATKCGKLHPVFGDLPKDNPLRTGPCISAVGHAGSCQDGPDGKGTSWG